MKDHIGQVALLAVIGLALVSAQGDSLQCPVARPGSVGICVEACSGDASCPEGQACCSNGCGHTCVEAVRLACAMVRCSNSCEFGFATDGNGCPTCDCKISPCATVRCPGGACRVVEGKPVCDVSSICPVYDCLPGSRCPFGYKTTAAGCLTCECKSSPCDTVRCAGGACRVVGEKAVCDTPCPVFMCLVPCPAGFAMGKDGCPTCECKPGECATKLCAAGYTCEEKATGAECVEAPCPPVLCEMFCPAGFATGIDGCPKCECKPAGCAAMQCVPGSICEEKTTGAECVNDVCPAVTCRLGCPAGFQKDPNGCEICQCADPCATMRCRSGYECKVQGGQAKCVRSCRDRVCPRQCEFGNVVNKKGCKTCRCNPDPCMRKRCGRNEECVLEKVQCAKEPCYPVAACQEVCQRLSCQCRFGHALDENGCHTCSCLVNPCETMSCPRLCLPIAFPCDQELCPMEAVCAGNWTEWISRLVAQG